MYFRKCIIFLQSKCDKVPMFWSALLFFCMMLCFWNVHPNLRCLYSFLAVTSSLCTIFGACSFPTLIFFYLIFNFYLGKSSDFWIFYINIIFVGSNMRCDQTEYVQCWIKKNIIYEIETTARVTRRYCNNVIYEWYSYVTSSFTGYVLMQEARWTCFALFSLP